MTGTVLALPVAVPLLAAGALLAVGGRRTVHRLTAMAVHAGVLLLGVALVNATTDGTVFVQNIGSWPPGIAIVLAADTLSALMLSVSALLALLATAFAAATADDGSPLFTPLALVLSAGVYGAFLTTDLFNLFVFVEVMLVPSYALLTQAGGTRRGSAARIYVTTSLLASTLLLAGVALVYGVTGTVSLAELAGAAQHSRAAALACSVVLLALATKAAVVPLHGWLPRTYPAAPPAVVVLFSGLLTKVAVYATMRVYALVFNGTGLRWVFMAAALLTMAAGVLGAVGEQAMKSILCFHMVSQIGYILLGIALFTPAGLAAAIFFQVQYVLVKAALLTCAGAVETTHRTDRLDRLGNLARQDPLLAAAFMAAALSLAGLPPLSGFVAKLGLIRAAASTTDYLALATAIAVSFFTLVSMIKIWEGAFWGEPTARAASTARPVPPPPRERTSERMALALPAVVLAAPSLLLGIQAQPLLTASAAAADGLINTSAYVRAVGR
ncbi:proton-conducting transporter membrane subunit [Streptomyces caeni]|uniref:Proton-conducting transporter membrane subunit n=1 Tax=Streptomyces caeni TaxID=2307231 RepID=A0ABW4IYD2_9ACTN